MVCGGGGEGKKVMEASQVVVRQVPRSICTVADDRHCPRGSVPDSRVPLSPSVPLSPRVGTRIYYSAACFTSGAETMKTRVETWAGPRTVRGPLLLVDLPPPPPREFPLVDPTREDWKEASMCAFDDRYS